MQIEKILELEYENTRVIHLVRDRLFIQAWEMSAFLFVRYFRPYKVHHRFIRKAGRSVAWLGFPKSILPELEKEARGQGCTLQVLSEGHLEIQGLPETEGFTQWKADLQKSLPASSVAPPSSSAPSFTAALRPAEGYLPAYKQAYDLTVHIYRSSAKFSREFRYSLGERLRQEAIILLEALHLLANHAVSEVQVDSRQCLEHAFRIRLELRLLKDLCQINIKQWGYLNQQLEILIHYLRPELCSPQSAQVSLFQSSDPLPAF